MTLNIFTDGGSRGNPGPSALGVWVTNNSQEPVYQASKYLGKITNNQAEYLAFIHSLEWLLDNLDHYSQLDQVNWYLDSKLVVEQLNRNWKIKDEKIKVLAEKAFQNLKKLTVKYKIFYVPREKNRQADALVNQALDKELGQY